MCGFAGFLTQENDSNIREHRDILYRMANAIGHRGPDSDGFWGDSASGINISHRRLSIVDISSAGNQPMVSPSNRFVIAFNGEIYNHLNLRRALEDDGKLVRAWRGHSDTETLLACIEAWGLEDTLQKTIGMFAIALWDKLTRQLSLVRDRFGEKPLYYGWQGVGSHSAFVFGSELSALRQHPQFSAEINRDSIALLMRHGCIGGSHSIYNGVFKLLPGNILTVSLSSPDPVINTWWSPIDVASRGLRNKFLGNHEQAVNSLDVLLRDAVNQQMVADVPLGAFLSGGVDSSAVVALMQSQSMRPIRTFSIGFYETGYNEAGYAKSVALHLGTEHTELYVTPEQARDVIPKLAGIYCEPFADSSQIPTYLVSKLARQNVTVALSGDAGDELFCGYTRYQMTERLWDKISTLPQPIRKFAADLIMSIPVSSWDALGRFIPYVRLGEKLHKGASIIGSNTLSELHYGLASHWRNSTDLVLNSHEATSVFAGAIPDLSGLGNTEQMMVLDLLSYLPDDILTKVDRAAMSVGLETRVPFLDHRVAEFAWSLPMDYKLRNKVTKWPLRQVLYRYVPKELIERPKMGFGVPIDSWLRGPLKDWAESLLNETRLKNEGFFDPFQVRLKWTEHLSGKRNWQYHLWNVLMFQAWLEEQTK